jgi:hypothetical protein
VDVTLYTEKDDDDDDDDDDVLGLSVSHPPGR